MCKNAARQINVLYKFRDVIDIKEKEVIYNTFILANVYYSPFVWMQHLLYNVHKENRKDSRKSFKFHT